jgi:transposase
LRCFLIVGAFAVLRRARAHPEKYPWVDNLLAHKRAKVAAVALANKTARIAWAVLTKKEIYRKNPTTAAAA